MKMGFRAWVDDPHGHTIASTMTNNNTDGFLHTCLSNIYMPGSGKNSRHLFGSGSMQASVSRTGYSDASTITDCPRTSMETTNQK